MRGTVPTLVNNVPKHMPDKRPVTLRMVAARAGVSLATASYALRSGSRAVTPALRQRVIDAADELGYELRPRGRLRTRALTVAAVVPDPTNSFFSDVLRAAEATLRAGGHRLVVSSSGEDEAQEEEIVSTVLRGRIDGLLLAPAGPVGPAVRALAASGAAVVLIDRDGEAPDLSSVVLDNASSARRATRLLAAGGCRRIAILNGPQRISTARDRLAGYLQGLADAALPVEPIYQRTVEFNAEEARRSADALLRLPKRPDGVFSASAILTSGLLQSMREHGLRAGTDVAVVGYGDAPWAALVEPAVTVIEQPTRRLGETAVRLLLADPSAPPQRVVLESQLILRDSHWRHGAAS